MASSVKVFLNVIMVLSIAGCAGFRAGNLSEIANENLIVNSDDKTKIFYENRFDTSVNVSDEALREAETLQRQNFFSQLSMSGCCELTDKREEADLYVTAIFGNHANPAAMVGAVLTGYSLYTIPSWITPKLSYKVDVATPSNATFHYEYADSYTMVQWLPMLFAFPFANPFPMEEAMQLNMYKHLIADMGKDGLLKLDDSDRRQLEAALQPPTDL